MVGCVVHRTERRSLASGAGERDVRVRGVDARPEVRPAEVAATERRGHSDGGDDRQRVLGERDRRPCLLRVREVGQPVEQNRERDAAGGAVERDGHDDARGDQRDEQPDERRCVF